MDDEARSVASHHSPSLASLAGPDAPAWCADPPYMDGQWWMQRHDTCRTTHNETIITDTNGKLISSFKFVLTQFQYAYTPDGLTTGYSIAMTPYGGSQGAFADVSVFGDAWCVSLCAGPDVVFLPARIDAGITVARQFRFTGTTTATGAVGELRSKIDFQFRALQTVLSLGVTAESYPVRCDNQLQGIKAAGCVFPVYEPEFRLNTNPTNNPNYWVNAVNVSWALFTGLPSRLTRHTDKVKSDANGKRACPSGDPYQRPPEYQCDEYPFRSTEEGASSSGTPFAPRTWDWCQLNWPNTPIVSSYVGPDGWARCNIPEGQNRRGGEALSNFYGNERVLAGDQFDVQTASW